ncbi:MAG: WD40 repeat domain-containing protein [Gemmataceae bacterium]|nr:WD40 repeat domain-containing protein [Gemmataceae bacterium]
MATLRLLPAETGCESPRSDVFGCAWTADGASVLTASWDGALRVHTALSGEVASELRLGTKPLSACAAAPDGTRWLAGSMDGMLGEWDPANGRQLAFFLAHPRPISAIVFSPDGQTLATAAWDGQVILWPEVQLRSSRTLHGHTDIVAGCAFTPDGRGLVSWSYDQTIRMWDTGRGRETAQWQGHQDRITAGAMSPDGRWFASGGRDCLLRLWDLQERSEAGSTCLAAEVRACLFLLDGESLVAADGNGRLTVHTLPELETVSEINSEVGVQCARLAPSGSHLVLGGADGALRFASVDGFDTAPLAITATRSSRLTASLLGRLLGRTREMDVFLCTCPACRRSFEMPASPAPDRTSPCPGCRRRLRVCAVV